MVGWSYVGNDVTHSTLLDRACACSYENLPKYRSYRVNNTTPRTKAGVNSAPELLSFELELESELRSTELNLELPSMELKSDRKSLISLSTVGIQ